MRCQTRSSRRTRSGVAVLLVLLMVTITMSISFSLLHTESTTQMIQVNSESRGGARRAAMTGSALALREITTATWQGVGSTLTGDISDTESYTVLFEADDTLSPGDPDYDDLPFRIKITITGTAEQPLTAGNPSTSTVQIIAKLAPEELSSTPSDWSTMMNYTLYQWDDQDVEIQLPFQLDGTARFQKKLMLAKDYPKESVREAQKVCIIRSTSSYVTYNEWDIKTILHDNYSLNYSFLLATSSQSSFDSMLNTHDAVYVPEDVSSTDVNTKLRNAHIGVINEERLLSDDMGTCATDGSTVTDGDTIKTTGVSHYITSPWSPNSNVTIFDDDEDTYYTTFTGTTAPNLQVLAKWGSNNGLGALEYGEDLYNSLDNISIANGRRVRLPWGGSSFDADLVRESSDGAKMCYRSVNWAGRISSLDQYLVDLRLMKLFNDTDYRPFTGTVTLPHGDQDSGTVSRLEDRLGLATINQAKQNTAGDWVQVTQPTNYRIYPGGPTYNIPTISGTINSDLGPSSTNPLGIYWCSANIHIPANRTIEGTLLSRNEVNITGSNVSLKAVEMPNFSGTSATIRLPVVVCQDFDIVNGSGGTAEGTIICWDEFETENDSENLGFTVTGHVITKKMQIYERKPWKDADWESMHGTYRTSAAQSYFPVWAGTQGRDPIPKLRIAEPTASYYEHWQYLNADNTIVEIPSGSDGLRWNVISWTNQ